MSGSGPRGSRLSRSTSDTSRQIRRTCVIAASLVASGIRGLRQWSSLRRDSYTSDASTAASCGGVRSSNTPDADALGRHQIELGVDPGEHAALRG